MEFSVHTPLAALASLRLRFPPMLPAEVVNRLHVYKVAVTPGTRVYMDAMMALPAWQNWRAQARAETWIIGKYEGA